MSNTRSNPKTASKESLVPLRILPLPEPLLAHHLATLERSMQQWKEQGRVPPVLLLTGPQGVGKRSICFHLAQWLLCERTGMGGRPSGDKNDDAAGDLFGDSAGNTSSAPTETVFTPKPCGECSHCLRALRGTWVDFQEIGGDTDEKDSASLKIDQFRNLKSTQGFGAFDGAYRITLIRDAERMTTQAANSLLKILEEPPPGWIFLLTAADACLLLPTLVSRCQVLRLKPLDVPTLVSLLELSDVPSARQRTCAELGQGSWGKALQLANEENWEQRESVFKFLELPQAEANALIDWAASEPRHFDLLITQLESVTAELLQWTVNPTFALSHSSLKSHALAAVKRHGSPEQARHFWMRRAERLFRARQEALAPLNRKLLIQDILLPWVESR